MRMMYNGNGAYSECGIFVMKYIENGVY